MTVTIKTQDIGELRVYMEQEKFSSAYSVSIVRLYDGYGKTLDKRVYPTKEKAQRRFRKLVKDAEENKW